jgi:PST family polysaccharide transporter
VTTLFGLAMAYVTHQPRLSGIIGFLSLSLVCLTMSVVPTARLMRQKNLSAGAGADLIATASAAAVAVYLAARGAGAWSLAIQYVTLNAIRSFILNVAAFHRPRLQFSLDAIRPHLKSGSILVSSRLSEFAGRIVENPIVDRLFGTGILGNYTFANQVSRFLTDTAGNTAWSGLYVQAITGERDKIVLLHRQLCRLLAILLFPATLLGAAVAPELIGLLLGPKWVDLPFFLEIYLPLYALTAICSQTGPILLAYDRFGIQFWCMLGLSIGRVLAVLTGFWLGLTGAMCSMVLVTLLYCAAMLVFSAEATGCQPIPMLRGLVRPGVASIVATAGLLEIKDIYPHSPVWILVSLVAAFLVYVLVLVLIDGKSLREDWGSIRRIMASRKVE